MTEKKIKIPKDFPYDTQKFDVSDLEVIKKEDYKPKPKPKRIKIDELTGS